MNSPLRSLASTIFLALAIPTVSAAVRLPAILGSHMVLQQKATVNLWGWSNASEKIRILTDWTNTLYEVVADSGGRWRAPIQTPAAGGPYKVIVTGSNAIVLEDVMVGEVWVCSGQSNMEWSGDQGLPQVLAEAPRATNTKIRFFYLPKTTADYPQERCEGSWKVCSPEEMLHFSAIGYFYGQELQDKLSVPVGLINSNWGGTPAEVWTPRDLVEKDPILAAAAGQISPAPWWPKDAGLCYNAMIHPLTPFKIAGVIWYQGESNTRTAETYPSLFTGMIDSWRKAWQEPFPFYFVQIAPFAYDRPNVGALLREAQTLSAAHPKTGMVVVSDLVEDVKNIHPVNKRDVAKRLANLALSQTYGRAGIAHQSPVYEQMQAEGDKIRIRFRHADQGLVAKNGPPTEFQIAGTDKVFFPASATIEDSSVVVSHPEVKQPVAVRFGFSNTAIPNLFSKEGLPVNLFRTDHWEVDTKPAAK